MVTTAKIRTLYFRLKAYLSKGVARGWVFLIVIMVALTSFGQQVQTRNYADQINQTQDNVIEEAVFQDQLGNFYSCTNRNFNRDNLRSYLRALHAYVGRTNPEVEADLNRIMNDSIAPNEACVFPERDELIEPAEQSD